MEFLEYLDSAVAGGLLGLIGGFGKQIIGYFERKNQREHELKVRKQDLEQTRLEAQSAENLAKIEFNKQSEMAAEKSFQTSILSEGARYYDGESKLLEWLDFFRGFNRIVLTWLLLICCMIIYFHIINFFYRFSNVLNSWVTKFYYFSII